MASAIIIEAIQKHDVVFGIGPAGTGKTYLAVAMAVAALKKEQVDRIILTRPAVEAGEALGFLPGDLQQRSPLSAAALRCACTTCSSRKNWSDTSRARRSRLRRSPTCAAERLSNAFVILDEAQNTTTEQMFMLLTRIGPRSKCVVTGDGTQIDLPAEQALRLAARRCRRSRMSPGIGFVYFNDKDVVRHELVRAIINAYQQHRSPANTGGSAGNNAMFKFLHTHQPRSNAGSPLARPAGAALRTRCCAISSTRPG